MWGLMWTNAACPGVIEHMFAAGGVEGGTLVVPDDPGVGMWAWLGDDPLGEAWWDPAGEGVEPGREVDREAEVAAPWLSAACLAVIAPGPGLASVLERVDLACANDQLLVETVAAAQRLAAWAHLTAALAAGELSGRAAMNPDWDRPIPTRTCVAGDELAMRLGWSKPAANRLVRDGQALGNELLLVADAVRDGLIDTSKLRVLIDRLADRPDQLSWPVLEAVLPGAASRTPTQLAADVDRMLLALDPQDAAFRLPAAIARRHVCHPRRLPDGMAGIWAVLPATDAARIEGTLEATARTARAAGDPRTLDQLRADALTALAAGEALLAGTTGAGPSRAAGAGGERCDAGDDAVSTPDSITDPACDRHLDHDTATVADQNPGLDSGGGPPTDDSPPDRAAPGIRIPKVRIDVTMALSTLMGLDEQPAELAGLGPIPAEQARALAMGGVWRRLVTDPVTGTVLDVGRTRYRPPAELAEHVMVRDTVCAAPGCSVPAHRCDLDHTTDYHATPANGSPTRGTTSAENLGPLSPRCHRLKTDGGFTLHQTAPGVFEWHTPAGLTYRVTPGQHGHTQRLDRGVTVSSSGYPDQPPF